MVPIDPSAVVTSQLMDILDFRLSSGSVWRRARKWARQNRLVSGYPFIPAASWAVCQFRQVTGGQMGGFGNEGPGTVVLHGSYRGAEAAAWEVNLTTG